MIKHWRLYESITQAQLKQLDIAGSYVKIENEISEIEFTIHKGIQLVKNQDIYISTSTDLQEILLHIMFPGTVKLIGYDDNYEYR